MKRPIPLMMIAALPLLLGSGDTGQRSAALTRTTCPVGGIPIEWLCQEGQVLMYQEGGIACGVPPVPDGPNWPDCQGALLTTVIEGDMPVLRCSPAQQTSPQDLERVRVLEDAVRALSTEISMYEATSPPGSAPPRFLGLTTGRTTGRVARPGSAVGLPSADQLCADEFGAGAYLCRVDDLYISAAHGNPRPDQRFAKAWIYLPAWSVPLPGAQNAEEGLADTCGSFTYDSTDHGWSGMAFEWAEIAGAPGVPVLKLHGGASAPCNGMLPLTCCK